ncbi:MAG: clostripain-related cysteine peptidase [Actinomycetota bacterium]
MIRRCGVALLVSALIAVGCSEGDPDALADLVADEPASESTTTTSTTTTTEAAPTTTVIPTTSESVSSDTSWTFLIYGMGDTDLEPFLLEDMVEMSGAAADDVEIIALIDRHPAFTDEGVLGLADFEDTKLLRVLDGEVEDLSDGSFELNLGDQQVLADFVEYGMTAWPADHTALILWDHGAGWTGMGPDETDGLDVLDLAEIQAGVGAGLTAAGADRLDLIGFDACLMATYEVASVVAPYADYMLASQELEPGHGWDYRALAGVGGSSPEQVGSALIAGYAAQARDEGADEAITLSLLDLSAMGAVTDAVEDLGSALGSPGSGPDVGRARARTLAFGRDPNPDLDSNLIDLGGLASNIATEADYDDSGLQQAMEALVVEQVTGPVTDRATGLAIYFPEYAPNFRQGYLFLDGVPAWGDALSAYYQAGENIAADELATFDPSGEVVSFFDEDGYNLIAELGVDELANAVDVTIAYGTIDESDDSIIYFGEEPAITFDDTGEVLGIYDLTVLTLTDSVGDSAVGYFDLTIDDEGIWLVDVPLAYVPPEEFGTDDPAHDVILTIIYDPSVGEILSETYYEITDGGTFGELVADPNGLIYPRVLNLYPDGTLEWITTSDVGLFASLPELLYDFEPMVSGDLVYAELNVYDFAGNVSTVNALDTVP